VEYRTTGDHCNGDLVRFKGMLGDGDLPVAVTHAPGLPMRTSAGFD
jgi:hypothetical protein